MKVSLIATTCNRYDEMKRLFDSLTESSYKDFELIVVDQSDEKRIEYLCEEYRTHFTIKYIKSGKIPLARARNIGLKHVAGDIVSFPDDDCWYNRQCLEGVTNVFANKNIHGICIGVFDPINNVAYSSVSSKRPVVKLNSFNTFKYTTSVGIFVRKDFAYDFDESLGIGAKWYGGEDIDYVLRLLYEGKTLYFYNDLKVYHLYNTGDINLDKEFKYCIGYGVVIKKAMKNYDFNFTGGLKYLSVYSKFFLQSLFTDNKDFYNTRIKGMKKGFKEYNS